VGLGGLEPPTSRLSGARSSQLSYRPREAGCAKRERFPNPFFSIQSVKEPTVCSVLQNQTASPDECRSVDLVDLAATEVAWRTLRCRSSAVRPVSLERR
jgi:hypothetical protein